MDNVTLCKYSKNLSQGLEIKLWCKKMNSPCGYYRYCTKRKAILMLDSYKNCTLRGEKVEYKKNIEDPIIEIKEEPKKKQPAKPKNRKQICNILNINENKFSVDFNGFGISIRDTLPKDTKKIEITFEGNFGEKGFKIVSHKIIK